MRRITSQSSAVTARMAAPASGKAKPSTTTIPIATGQMSPEIRNTSITTDIQKPTTPCSDFHNAQAPRGEVWHDLRGRPLTSARPVQVQPGDHHEDAKTGRRLGQPVTKIADQQATVARSPFNSVSALIHSMMRPVVARISRNGITERPA